MKWILFILVVVKRQPRKMFFVVAIKREPCRRASDILYYSEPVLSLRKMLLAFFRIRTALPDDNNRFCTTRIVRDDFSVAFSVGQ